jgi:hypothetical protein
MIHRSAAGAAAVEHQPLYVPADGPVLTDADQVLDIVGQALGAGADLVVLPVSRLDETFFDLRTGLAGHILQKFANYRLRLVILGDVSRHVAASDALRDLVRESNRGGQTWFASDKAELAARLALP